MQEGTAAKGEDAGRALSDTGPGANLGEHVVEIPKIFVPGVSHLPRAHFILRFAFADLGGSDLG